MTNDPATWTQGKLLTEVYKLKSMNNELVEALKLSYRSLTIDSDMEKDFAVEIKKIKQALAKAESDPIK